MLRLLKGKIYPYAIMCFSLDVSRNFKTYKVFHDSFLLAHQVLKAVDEHHPFQR